MRWLYPSDKGPWLEQPAVVGSFIEERPGGAVVFFPTNSDKTGRVQGPDW